MSEEMHAELDAIIRGLRVMVAEKREELQQLEAVLRDALLNAGRRPGDGSDQPQLFQAEAQARLW